MNCPNCGAELSPGAEESICPYCGYRVINKQTPTIKTDDTTVHIDYGFLSDEEKRESDEEKETLYFIRKAIVTIIVIVIVAIAIIFINL